MGTTLRFLATSLCLLLGFITTGDCLVPFGMKSGRLRNRLRPPPPPPIPEGRKSPSENWFTQHLDNFNPSDNRTWSQRYFINDEVYQPGGPVFLYIEGEGPAGPGWLMSGSMYDYAVKLNAILISVEHRYYGLSRPTEDLSTENLSFLSSEQALADLARFTTAMNEELGFTDSKWIAFGGSYAGSLAAWYRLKYPHLVHGAVATSAPMPAQVDFKEYYEVVRDSLATVSEDCNIAIKAANDEILRMVQDPAAWRRLTDKFLLCDEFDGLVRDDTSSLFEALAISFAGTVQYNSPNDDVNIDTLCGIMMNESLGTPIDRYELINWMFLDEGYYCLDHTYSGYIEYMRLYNWDDDIFPEDRLWAYQDCTEFGYYQNSDSEEQPFGHQFPLDYFIQQCQQIFGPSFTSEALYDGVARTNTMYGGKEPKLTRVVFPNGSIDPWHAVSITSNLSSDATAIYIHGTSHCANMDEPQPNDPPELREAIDQIFNLIQQWLSEE